jgi:hypothetical protein
MRYLNKIVFINSAKIPYAEIQLDGNIHFIGTQGVGKSTVLRAILYFYNADSRKLGIPKGTQKTVKSFADWYLGYGNSFIIYEVAKETGAFCVIAFKSQNRVCYRFIDTPYKAAYFIKDTGEVHSNWDTIRQNLDADRINISSMVNSYDQYRDILYGNFTGKKEFKKYALLEAKQYKNIYRTIQNVFLNTKLDANEIKQTIISSMEEEHIAIDLEQYNHHLDGFEKNLNDIKEFRRPSVQKQTENATKMLSAIRHINREQKTLAGQLKYRLETIEKEKPELEDKRTQFNDTLYSERKNLNHEKDLFEKRKAKINDGISQLNGKLKDSSRRKKYYDGINITELITRVSANEEKKLELDSLKNERTVLTNQFGDINNKYDALVKEQEHQLNAFVNQKENQKVEIDRGEVKYILELNGEYEKLFLSLEKEHEAELKDKESKLTRRIEGVHKLDKQKVAIKYTKLYEKEIEQARKELSEAELTLKQESNNIITYQQQVKTLQAKWSFENSEAEKNNERKKEKLQDKINIAVQKKNEIEDKVNKSKDSLYGWLNQNKPGWENSIGKVIDENLLFQNGLSPKVVNDTSSLFGLEINLDEIELKIKTIEAYKFEMSKLTENIEQFQKDIQELTNALEKEKENIQRRNLPKIKELKEQVRQAEYLCEQSKRQIEKSELDKNSYTNKALNEKLVAIEKIQVAIDEAIVLREEASEALKASKSKLRKSKENKQKEKTRRTNDIKAENQSKIQVLQHQIKEKQNQIKGKIESLKSERNNELNNKGADTGRLSEIEKQITTVENELAFIEKNRDKVSDYHKDKRELFDKEKDFKNEVKGLEAKLTHNQDQYFVLHGELSKKIEQIELRIKELEASISSFQTDEEKYESFTKTSAFKVVEDNQETSSSIINSNTAIRLIEQITEKYYISKEKQDELKTSIDKFLSHFSDGNIFSFPAKLLGTEAYINWAEDLSDFIEEGKINQFEKRTNERFSFIINSVGKETTMLISKTGEIQKIIRKINADFSGKRFLEAVTNIQLDIKDSKNTAVMLLKKIKEFNDDNALSLGAANLFSGTNHDKSNEKAVELLKQLVKEINQAKNTVIELTDSFELTFRVEENGNDTGWVEKLTNVGSEGTDVLVKAMINIMLLNVFKEGASRKFKDFKLHCMMDEIGKLHPNNVKGILNFANDRNIMLINGSPTESTPLNYRHIYKLSKDASKNSKIKRIISNPVLVE